MLLGLCNAPVTIFKVMDLTPIDLRHGVFVCLDNHMVLLEKVAKCILCSDLRNYLSHIIGNCSIQTIAEEIEAINNEPK